MDLSASKQQKSTNFPHWQKLMRFLHLQSKPKEKKDIDILKESLQLQGFNDEEINDAFVKYDITDRRLDLEEMKLVEMSLRSQKTIDGDEVKMIDRRRELSTINQRVDRLENTVLDVCQQIDTVISMISQLQRDLVFTNKQTNLIKMEEAARTYSPYGNPKAAEALPEQPATNKKEKKRN
ncbi:unnamed protein product [Enterobius vermicularis]|uniref:Uncharacterized protein n=1 Tax=Enterobius vermicularis TaxID=51028 RepID=A0A0N4V6D3_ENTVE|nr:unnamed protein product [Enterobius vermicularis]